MKKLFIAVLLYSFHFSVFAANDTAIFASGCFWCMEKPFDQIDGVISTTSGYIGGHTDNPTYKSTSSGTTGHYEALEAVYDPDKVSYGKLLEIFWKNIGPFDARGQFCDKGPQYRGVFLPITIKKKIWQQRVNKHCRIS